MSLNDEQRYSSADPKEYFGFEKALECLRKGLAVSRHGWNGKGQFIKLQRPDENSKMTEAYIYFVKTKENPYSGNRGRYLIPWLASQADLLWNDWFIVSPE